MDTIAASCFELAPGTARRLDHADGRELFVLRGRVWLTCSGYGEDLFVSAGHALRLGPGAVIECDGPVAARLRLEPVEAGWFARAGRALAALARRLPRWPVLRPAAPDLKALDGGCNG
ncbi:DUF2917 domain-containing protein [Azohydromonas caseinilytica]|uniref:DUF2917 domain-containing protein n=1 Tax=Azohydromonas caseinilytica TaxID=2728836 RepID=A0A848FHB2_9BURK|nr:DUF2917 domain-containing protein [Azohydromonas caseinilytica]NML17643.1 DUF2917 domain-containing protein [Azohydromonas caseinilytica]